MAPLAAPKLLEEGGSGVSVRPIAEARNAVLLPQEPGSPLWDGAMLRIVPPV